MSSSPVNILICGYPKSGTTWLTKLTADLLQCPAYGFWEVAGDTLSQEGLDRVSPYRCYKAHQLYEELQASEAAISKIIYIVRDPRDIAVSGAYHFIFLPNRLKSIFQRIVPSFSLRQKVLYQLNRVIPHSKKKQAMVQIIVGKYPQQLPWLHYAWPTHVQSFIHQPQVLLIKYEDALTRPLPTCQAILDFLEYPVALDKIQTAIERNAFATKKQQYITQKDAFMARHIRKGQAGEWVRELTREQAKIIMDNCQALMNPLGYRDSCFLDLFNRSQ